MAARICMNFTTPIAPTNRTIAASMKIIRFFMDVVSSWLCPINVALVEQRSTHPGHFGTRDAVIGLSGNFVESGARQIVLAREHQEIGREPHRIALPLG